MTPAALARFLASREFTTSLVIAMLSCSLGFAVTLLWTAHQEARDVVTGTSTVSVLHQARGAP